MTAGIQLRAVGAPQVDLLIEMYERFDPIGAALGLPPYAREARHRWVRNAVRQIVNVAAFSPAGEIVGHCFLAGDAPGSAEAAAFVHQEFRRQGLGTALLRSALEFGRAHELDAAWAVTATDNRAALRLLETCGFRVRHSDVDIAEFDIHLSVIA